MLSYAAWDKGVLEHIEFNECYPLYAALVVGVGAVSGAIYANPLIHLKFIWVFFGLIV